MSATDDEELEAALAALSENARRPAEEGRALPPEIYRSPGVLALEEAEIFRKEWICVGRVDAVPAPGDYLACEILDQPVAVVRGRDGEVRAFSNVCLHRMSRLLEGRGSCRRIVCPYHAWTYDLDGRLVGAPHMEGNRAFDRKDYRLPEVRAEVWEGWVYVTLNADAPPVAERLAELHDRVVGRYRMAGYVETFREERVWDTNWKILAENFMESYHLFKLHEKTVGPHSRIDEMECPPGGDAFNFHWITKEASLAIGNAHPSNTHLEGDWRRTTALVTVYPSHLITLTPGYFWYLCLQPRGVGRVHITYGGGFAPEYAGDAEAPRMASELKAMLDAVNEEDRVGVENVFRGACAGLARPGHLSHLERPNFEFGQYLARMLTRGRRAGHHIQAVGEP